MCAMTDGVLQFEQYRVAWLCFLGQLLDAIGWKYMWCGIHISFVGYTIVHFYQYRSGHGSTEDVGGCHIALPTGTVQWVCSVLLCVHDCNNIHMQLQPSNSSGRILIYWWGWRHWFSVLITDTWHCNSFTQEHRSSNTYLTQAAGGVEQFIRKLTWTVFCWWWKGLCSVTVCMYMFSDVYVQVQ